MFTVATGDYIGLVILVSPIWAIHSVITSRFFYFEVLHAHVGVHWHTTYRWRSQLVTHLEKHDFQLAEPPNFRLSWVRTSKSWYWWLTILQAFDLGDSRPGQTGTSSTLCIALRRVQT